MTEAEVQERGGHREHLGGWCVCGRALETTRQGILSCPVTIATHKAKRRREQQKWLRKRLASGTLRREQGRTDAEMLQALRAIAERDPS